MGEGKDRKGAGEVAGQTCGAGEGEVGAGAGVEGSGGGTDEPESPLPSDGVAGDPRNDDSRWRNGRNESGHGVAQNGGESWSGDGHARSDDDHERNDESADGDGMSHCFGDPSDGQSPYFPLSSLHLIPVCMKHSRINSGFQTCFINSYKFVPSVITGAWKRKGELKK